MRIMLMMRRNPTTSMSSSPETFTTAHSKKAVAVSTTTPVSEDQQSSTSMKLQRPPILRLKLQEELIAQPATPLQASVTPVMASPLLLSRRGITKSWSCKSSVCPSVATRRAGTTMTSSSPIDADSIRRRGRHTDGAGDVGCCIMWVHLQTSICTEWEQNSMVLTPNSGVGARVMTNKNKPLQQQTSTTNNVSSILEALANSDSRIFGQPAQKRPKTIHRCILQRASPAAGRSANKSAASSLLKCHVCHSAYDSYSRYFDHLVDSTCARLKEAKDLAALAATAATHQAPITPEETPPMSESSNRTVRPPKMRPRQLVPDQSPQASLDRAKVFNFEHVRTQSIDNSGALFSKSQPAQKDVQIRFGAPKSTKVVTLLSEGTPTSDENSSPKADEETPLNLSVGSSDLEDSNVAPNSPPLPLKKRRRVCPHAAASTLPPISLVSAAADAAALAAVKARTTALLVSLLGEARLIEMGSPEKNVLCLLKSVLEAAGATVARMEDACGESCGEGEDDDAVMTKQVRLRMVRSETAAAEKNLQSLQAICGQDQVREEEK